MPVDAFGTGSSPLRKVGILEIRVSLWLVAACVCRTHTGNRMEHEQQCQALNA
jgi:hypothetical protein